MSAHHGFIDESIRLDGWYRLTLVTVDTSLLSEVTRALRSSVPKGGYRVHFSAESAARRRQILDRVVELPISSTTFASPYRRGTNEEPARASCLRAAIGSLDRSVVVLVFDSRGTHRDRLDRHVLRQALVAAERVDSLNYSHRGSRDELLLTLPDVLGWAIGAGGEWRRRAAMVATVVEADTEAR